MYLYQSTIIWGIVGTYFSGVKTTLNVGITPMETTTVKNETSCYGLLTALKKVID